jgi:hypothetical protein
MLLLLLFIGLITLDHCILTEEELWVTGRVFLSQAPVPKVFPRVKANIFWIACGIVLDVPQVHNITTTG